MAKYPFTYVHALIPTLFALPLVQCNVSHCENLRDELQAQKQKWGECETSLDCIKVFGSRGDCTGILSCDFSVNRKYRTEAERRVASLPEETVDCVQCQSPNCVGGKLDWCEPVTKQCMVVTELLGDAPDSETATGGVTSSGGSGGTTGGSGGTTGGSGGMSLGGTGGKSP
jgi:uncharacterized membrane protein YgcG